MTSAKRPTRAEKQIQTRAQLIDAGARVFARRGFQAATVEEIAEHAGYSHGAVYSNFSGKEGLFLAVFEQYMSERIEEVARASEIGGSFPERARAAADQWMRRFGEDRETFLLHLEFMIHAARNPKLSKQLGERMAVLRLEVERRIAERAAETEIPLPIPPLSSRWSCARSASGSPSRPSTRPARSTRASTATSSRSSPACSKRAARRASQPPP